MANIQLNLNHPLQDGEDILFQAPSDSLSVTGLQITYPVDIEGTKESAFFTLRDANQQDLTQAEALFSAGAYLKAVVDTTKGFAYLQNASSGYLENQITPIQSNTAVLTADAWSNNAQTITVAGITATDTVVVSPAPASFTAYTSACVYCSAQADGTLSFACEDVPVDDLTVNLLILGVKA